ncbi:DUF5305 domain-containing protein [Natrinema sp. HArc-T2]|uniref:DUF5305 domain-containing protein n=1 Tax=Natrinema sp. HArc-T2 TaxID=3242701 RepID=UPI00359D7C77
MNSDRLLVRARAALAEWYTLVVVVLLAVALVGGWGAYTSLAGPAEEMNRDTTESWSTTGSFDHSAEVTSENEVYPVGTELSDRSVYFTDVTPELEGTFTYRYDADAGDVTANVELERVIRSADDEQEYWVVNETIAETSAEGLAPGEEVTTDFAVDVPATVNESERIEESLGGSPGSIETVVVATVALQGTVDGESVERTEQYELALEPDGSTYTVSATESDRDGGQQTETGSEVTTASAGGLGLILPLVVLLGSLGGLGAIVAARHSERLAPSEVELERLRSEYERKEFDEWISRGSLPDEVRDRPRIEVSTLEDLVDVAIDCDRRVLEDESAGEYYVVDGESLYAYESEELENSDLQGETPSDGEAFTVEPVTDGSEIEDEE